MLLLRFARPSARDPQSSTAQHEMAMYSSLFAQACAFVTLLLALGRLPVAVAQHFAYIDDTNSSVLYWPAEDWFRETYLPPYDVFYYNYTA